MKEAIKARLDAHEAALLALLREYPVPPADFGKGLELSPAARAELERLAKKASEHRPDWP